MKGRSMKGEGRARIQMVREPVFQSRLSVSVSTCLLFSRSIDARTRGWSGEGEDVVCGV